MKISQATSWQESFELTRPYTIAFKSFDSVENFIVRIETAEGLIGLGAAAPVEEITGESHEASAQSLSPDGLAWLAGQDVRELTRLCRENRRHTETTPAAGAAVDMALHDLFAQHIGLPLVEVLGRAHTALPTSITIGIMSVSETLEEAREYLDRGFSVLKVKLGRSLDEDIERLCKLRERVGAGVTIRVDPNQGYTRENLAEFVKRTALLNIEFLEQPLAAEDVEGMRQLPEVVRDRLAADESLISDRDALILTNPPRACGIFNIKLMKCGGVSGALRIATVAELAGVKLMWGCMDESRISIAAALHTALSCPATRYLDLDGSLDLKRDVVDGGFILEDGILRPTDAPGLGVRLCE